MTFCEVTHRFVKLVDAIEHAYLKVDPSFALALSLQEARELYHDLYKCPDIAYYVSGGPGMLEQRVVHLPGGPLVPPFIPTREHNVWMVLYGITIIIKGTEDE